MWQGLNSGVSRSILRVHFGLRIAQLSEHSRASGIHLRRVQRFAGDVAVGQQKSPPRTAPFASAASQPASKDKIAMRGLGIFRVSTDRNNQQ